MFLPFFNFYDGVLSRGGWDMTVILDNHRSEYDPFRESLVHPMHLDFLDYWRHIAPPVGLPGRRELEPIDIPRLLPWILLLDVT
jgi:hypothetical protein